MSKKHVKDRVQVSGRPAQPIENGFQMNMAERFKDRYVETTTNVEFGDENDQHKIDRNNKRTSINKNQNKPNYIPRKKPKDYNQ